MLPRRSRRHTDYSPDETASSSKPKKRTTTPDRNLTVRKNRSKTPLQRAIAERMKASSSKPKKRTTTPDRNLTVRKNRSKTPLQRAIAERMKPRSRLGRKKINNNPQGMLKPIDTVRSVDKPKKETIRGKSSVVIEPVNSTITTPASPAIKTEFPDYLIEYDGSEDENEPTNNRSILTKLTEFGRLFGNHILFLVLCLIVYVFIYYDLISILVDTL